MRPELAARTLATIGALLLILAAALRLLSVYLLISDPRLQSGGQNAIQAGVAGPDPALGLYAFSADGAQVRFERGVFTDGVWRGGVYTLNLADGTLTQGDILPQSASYVVEEGQVWLKDNLPGSPRLSLSIPGQVVSNPVLSEDGQALAYVAGRNRLYAIRGIDPAELIDEQEGIREVAWAPDRASLVYIAAEQGDDQIFLYDFADRQRAQLTHDQQVKSSPRFSRDGRLIAFLAGPPGASLPVVGEFQPLNPAPASGLDVYVMDIDGQSLVRLTRTILDETSLGWTADNQVAFSAWQPHWPSVAYLYAVAPGGSEPQRIFPAVAIEQFACRPALPGGSRARVQIEVSNDSDQVVSVPLEVSADRQPLDLLTNRSRFRVQREELTLQPGETLALDWTVEIPEDLRVYLAASIESGVDFPISAGFCQITPRRLFIPRLPLLRSALLLVLAGSLLFLPWLRHLHRRWAWAFLIAYIILFLGLIAFESWLLLRP